MAVTVSARTPVLPNVRQAFADLAGLAFHRNGEMKTADVEYHQDKHDKGKTDGIEEKTRGRAEGRNRPPPLITGPIIRPDEITALFKATAFGDRLRQQGP